ncbi:hypothetical protein A3F65_04035 [Candidatus Saccharibacteria bacterium RIFCSPHIGHO2_12_FULL_47_16b]|nr:MAG: hypothetical protein A3F65_04035 [Candidatus Saccharibacteria bacterium RIFCSPHIGHO2_12_FULL_47_16b]OGL39371.1 MAG: hypothetical protein A3J32_00310 [Candidatus Saccharibacteria bacterium RIFCSPLOWO2_02_FULL_46_7]
MKLLHLPFTIYPRHQILMLHNLIADYSAQDLMRGRHLPLISHLPFTKLAATSALICKLIFDKSLKIDNCELIIATTEGVA